MMKTMMISLGRSSRFNALILNIWMIFYRKEEIQKYSCLKKMNINLLIQKLKNEYERINLYFWFLCLTFIT